jgi:hypothetical protein
MMSFLTYITGFFMNFELLPIQDGADGHNFERGPPKDHFSKVWLRLAQYFQRRFFFNFIHGQNCSILSQKVPKFELYKHNDEIFNIYYGIFYEL